MDASCDIPELPDDDAVLREIAAMDLALARRLYGQAMAEPDTEKAADITRAYNRVTRSLRQSIALRARLAQGWENHHVNHGRRVDLTAESPTMAYRTRVQPAPAQPAAPSAAASAEAARRRAILQRAIQRIVWNERETERLDRPQAARLRDRIADELIPAAADPALAGQPVERLVAAVCRRYGLRYNPDWETLARPPDSWLFLEWNSPTTGEGPRQYIPLIPANAGTQILWRRDGLEWRVGQQSACRAFPSGSRHSPG